MDNGVVKHICLWIVLLLLFFLLLYGVHHFFFSRVDSRVKKRLSFIEPAMKNAPASLLGRHTKIEPENPDLLPYSDIILGSPIWTGKLSMAIRTLIDKNKFEGKKVVIFTTTNAYEEEKYKEKSKNLVRKAGGEVVGYYQVLAKEEVNSEKIDRTKEKIIEDTLSFVPEIKKAFFLAQ